MSAQITDLLYNDTFWQYVMLELKATRLTEEQRVRKWQIFVKRAMAQERLFKTKLRPLFKQQKAEVLANMKKSERAVIVLSKQVRAEKLVAAYLKAKADDWLFDEKKWRVRFAEMEQLLLPQTIEEVGSAEMATLVVGVDFDVSNPRVVEWIQKKKFKFSFVVNDETKKHLKREFVAGLNEGEGIWKLRKRVDKVFGFADKVRSTRIARTEILSASNYGAFESYTQSGVVSKKEWNSTKDDRVREEHKPPLDGQQVGLQEPFSNGLMYPGDPSGPLKSFINCRCSIIPVVER